MTHGKCRSRRSKQKIYYETKVLFVGYRFMITLSLYLFLYSFTIRSFLYTGTAKTQENYATYCNL